MRIAKIFLYLQPHTNIWCGPMTQTLTFEVDLSCDKDEKHALLRFTVQR